MRRRHFLVLSAASVGGVLVYSLDRKVSRLSAQDKSTQLTGDKTGRSGKTGKAAADKTVRIPLRFFTESEAAIVAAAVARIFPSDESGPGAREAGVVIFIDRQLAGPWGRDARRYTHEPFEEVLVPEFGYQGKGSPRDVYRQGVKDLAGFDALTPAQQDEKLQRIENSVFFQLLRRNTIEGMFSDPIHGGNVDMVGWQLIGFPGPRMSNVNDINKHNGEAFRPKPVSLSQVVPSPVRPSEEQTESVPKRKKTTA
jgi:gluconate 2-dehydrogenase gamma chain